MKKTRTLILALLAAGAAGRLSAQEPIGAAAAPQSEMQKWIATTDAQWQEAFKKGITDVHEAEVNKMKLQYLTMLEDAIAKASKASDLTGAVALRDEQKRFGDTLAVPEQDEPSPTVALKQIRAAIRAQFAKVEKDNTTRIQGLLAKYDAQLAQVQAQLTQKQRLDDALLVKAKREEVAKAWLSGTSSTPPPATVPPPPPLAVEPAKPLVPPPVKPAVPEKPAIGQKTVKMDDRALAAKLLEIGFEVHGSIDGKSSKITSADQIAGKKVTVVGVALGKKEWTEADFAIFEQLDDIRELGIRNNNATDAMMDRVRACRKLRSLTLVDLPNLTGRGLQFINNMPDLTSVAMVRLSIDDAGFKSAFQKSKVEKFEITNIGIGDGAFVAMGEMPSLQSAHLNTLPGLTAAGWDGLSKAKKLRGLILQKVDPGPEGLAHLAKCKSLESVDFRDFYPTEDELPAIRTMTHLRSLSLSNAKSPASMIALLKAALPKANISVRQ